MNEPFSMKNLDRLISITQLDLIGKITNCINQGLGPCQEEEVYGKQLKETYINTDKVGSLSGILPNSYDLLMDDIRVFLRVPEDRNDRNLVTKLHIPTFEETSSINGFSVYPIPMTSRPLTRYTLPERKPERGYIGAFEILEKLAAVLAKINKEGYKLDDFTFKSIVLCPGEEQWLRFLPDAFHIHHADKLQVVDYPESLGFDILNPINNQAKLKGYFQLVYSNLFNDETSIN